MKKLILMLLPLLLSAGCIRQDDLRIHDIKDVSVSIGTAPSVNAVVVVENTLRREIRISDALFRVTDREGNEIGTLTVAGELRIPGKSITGLAVPLRVRLTNPMFGLGLLGNIEKSAQQLMVNGSARIKAGMFKKKLKVENMPLSEFLSIFTGGKE